MGGTWPLAAAAAEAGATWPLVSSGGPGVTVPLVLAPPELPGDPGRLALPLVVIGVVEPDCAPF